MAPGKQIPFVLGRFHNVYGARMGADHAIPELSLRALRREDPFKLYGATSPGRSAMSTTRSRQ